MFSIEARVMKASCRNSYSTIPYLNLIYFCIVLEEKVQRYGRNPLHPDSSSYRV
jgi:hypothetical protein